MKFHKKYTKKLERSLNNLSGLIGIARKAGFVIVGGENGSWEKVHQQGLHHLGGVNAMKKNKLEGRQIWADFWNSLTVDQKE